MSDKSWVYYPIGTYMYRARLAMYAHVQSKQVRLLPKGHVCIYIHKFHIFHSSNSSLGFNGLKYMAPNTLFYTQIRSPFSQAVSCFKEFGGVKRYGLRGQECPFCSFISSGKEETYFQIRNWWHPNHAAPITRNFQAFTLGYMNAI